MSDAGASAGAGSGKSKMKQQTTKAERRAMQEAQRAAKAEKMGTGTEGKSPRGKPHGNASASKASSSAAGAAAASSTSSAAASSASTTSNSVGQEEAKESKKPSQAARGRPEHRIEPGLAADDSSLQAKRGKKLAKYQIPQRPAETKCRLFSHLHVHERDFPLTSLMPLNTGGIHPEVLRLGLMYASYSIRGGNARCLGLLKVLKLVVGDYTTPPSKVMARDFETKLKPLISFLTTARPLSISMGHLIKQFKLAISTLPPELPEDQAKTRMITMLENYRQNNFHLANQSIIQLALERFTSGAVLMTFAHSIIVREILLALHKKGTSFRVVVVDSRPYYEGLTMLKELQKEGIPCTYVLLNAVNYVIKQVTHVLMGAAGMLANGQCVSRCGSALVACTARRYDIPVLIACGTFKFSEKVRVDSVVSNELGDGKDIINTRHPFAPRDDREEPPRLAGLVQSDLLCPINLAYDYMPPEFITLLLTEVGSMPCSSVPAVLRLRT